MKTEVFMNPEKKLLIGACEFVLWTLSVLLLAIKRWHRKLGTKFVTHNSPIMQFLPIP